MSLPNCLQCQSEYVYEDGLMLICPMCSFEWPADQTTLLEEADTLKVLDSNGTQLQDGDSVTVIKDLKVKGAPKDIKQGTRVKNIRLVEGDHNIDCKIDGFGAMKLKSEFVKKL
ncbi:zinc ribbon domain-containing protein YjdM [Streptococcus porcinus]|uniref:Alkylphosphonate utilization protein n=1 Tax=Streptococcus porcinus TaxID=1340 RepID=A0A7W0ART0_STRPO|nr:zinc ribbon domain-containing protein YjdM [Streptococcus porcinus]MBA2796533.1 alkylphosphonate utilization protein [Streptococcus porcinus]